MSEEDDSVQILSDHFPHFERDIYKLLGARLSNKLNDEILKEIVNRIKYLKIRKK